MISLLDANVLIALFDAAHVQHRLAHRWLRKHRASGWATCPLTQCACIRVLSQPAYPGRLTVADISRRLAKAVAADDHHFWPESLMPCDPGHFAHDRILSPKHLTDLYLLALARENEGRLVTFDTRIPAAAVPSAQPENLLVLASVP